MSFSVALAEPVCSSPRIVILRDGTPYPVDKEWNGEPWIMAGGPDGHPVPSGDWPVVRARNPEWERGGAGLIYPDLEREDAGMDRGNRNHRDKRVRIASLLEAVLVIRRGVVAALRISADYAEARGW